jgi:hypothetical protein
VLELALEVIQPATVAVVEHRHGFSTRRLFYGYRLPEGFHLNGQSHQLAATAPPSCRVLWLDRSAAASAPAWGTVTTGQLAWLMQ